MASDFATNPTTTSVWDDTSYASIITDVVLDALMATVVTPSLLDFYDLSGEASLTVKIPKADKFTASAATEGTELANTPLTSHSVTGTSSEIGFQATITDILDLSDIPAAHGARLRQIGRALADKLDVDICALFAGFTNTAGTTNTNLGLTHLLDAIYVLENADAGGLGPLVGVFHPRQIADIRSELEADVASIYSPSDKPVASVAGRFGSWFGIEMFQSTNVPTSNAGVDRAGAVFVRDFALGMVQKWGAKVEPMRWAPIRGWVLCATAHYGVFEVEDLAGVEMSTDAD